MTTREVVLEGGAPWGFRMHGGVDHNQPLRISRVNPGSKAAVKGIREGDLISSINGQSTRKLTNFEAHGLLRSAGETLKLGLNEDPSGSPKRRQYRTVHQETLQETVKRSSVTTYSVSKTIETTDSQSDTNNENSISKTGHSSINGTSNAIPPSNLLVTKKSSSSSSSSPTLTKEGDLKNTSSDHALASQRSSYTNCTLSPSSPSILSEDGVCSCTPSHHNVDKQNILDNMNDSSTSSRSKRRRQRRKNQRKITESQTDNNQNFTNICDNQVINEFKHVQEDYTVQSPVELAKDIKNNKKKTSKPIKSRSLDDDDMVKIQEVSELSEVEDKDKETQAIVSEASESEVEWEETEVLNTTPPLHGSLSTFTLPLEVCSSEQVTLMSPEEEKTLRDFLQGLNLVNGPEEAANQVYEKNTIETIKQRKAKKKAELEQYFLPIYHNPRYLDVISEESSDRDSDREQTNKTRILRKGTPEQDASSIPPKVPPRRRKYLPPIEQAPAVLVDTKIIDSPTTTEAVCTTIKTGEEASASTVEIVYLNSSETDSAEEQDSVSSDSYHLASDKDSSCEDISEKTLIDDKTEPITSDQEFNITHKQDYISKESAEKISEINESLKTASSSQYSFTIKSNKDFSKSKEDVINIDLLSQLTPPPTPDNTSPNDTKFKESPKLTTTDTISDKYSKFSTVLKINPGTETTYINNILTPPTPSVQDSPNTYTKYSTTLEIKPDRDTVYTNNITPPPPSRSRSRSSSSESSSRESSQCTAKYNPSSSSLTDVISLTKTEVTNYYQALTLREICLKFLLALPFGKEILEELADVSKYIEPYTSSLPSSVLPKLVPNLAQFVKSPHTNNNNISYNLSVHLPSKILQEDITNVNKISILSESTENIKNSIKNANKSTVMERIIPIKIDSDSEIIKKEDKSCQQEGIIPIDIIEESVNRNIKRVSDTKEVIVPFKFDKKEHNYKSNIIFGSKEVIIPIKIEKENNKTDQKSFAKEEINIPIKIEKETTTKSKETVIHIQKESNREEVRIPGEATTKGKETIIPIQKESNTKEVRILEKTTPKGKETIIPIQKESNREEVKIPGETTTKGKETIIPIQKESNTKEVRILEETTPKGKETIIPIQKESNRQEVRVPEETTPKRKETIIPVQIEPDSMSNRREIKIPVVKDWVGMPTEKDPSVLLCLSPKQKDQLEKSKQVPDEAGRLLELHEKFINRRSCHEDAKKEIHTVTTNQTEQSSRLLSIIREEPTALTDEKNYLYFVEKEPNPRLSTTLPRNANKARLNAKDLTEWLNLARNKSMSESNLTTVPDIPENNLRNYFNKPAAPMRRTSLPHELYEKQMIYIREKEREIQRQLDVLEEEKRKLSVEMTPSKQFHAEDYNFSRKGDFAESKKRPKSMPLIPTEYFRQQMYEEYMDKFAEREERKQHKIIKVTSAKDVNQEDEKAVKKEIIHPIQIEQEFMSKVKQKQQEGKLEKVKSLEKERETVEKPEDEPPVLVMDGEKLKEAKELPKHLQEFVGPDGIWSPGQKIDLSPVRDPKKKDYESQDESIPPMWTPKSANSSPTAERKEFRSVNFQSPVLNRRTRTSSENLGTQVQAPPWKIPDYNSDTGSASSILERRLPTSRSTPATGFSEFSNTSRLPKAQNPTITLLQKAREGQFPKGASYIEQEPRQYKPKNDRPPIAGPGEVFYQIKHEYTSESDNERPRKMTDLGPRKFEGIGPVTTEGIPLVLRSEVKDQNQSKWYKRMYDTIHKQKPHNDEYVTVRYKQKRAQYPYTSGYLSEPEPGAYDSDFTDYKYQTLDRRRPPPQDRSSDYISSTMPRPTVNRSISSDVVKTTSDYYRQPGKIENYTPGHSSISEKEAKQWWDEVMDIFDGHLEQQNRVQSHGHPKSFINQALKESGYESDSTLVFRRREEAAAQQLSPKEQREAYKVIQKGGDVPLHGLRKLAPERPKDPEPPVPPPKGVSARSLESESPRKYVENEVTIHYKTPVRQEIKEYLSEDELAHRQAEAMKKMYQEERRKKYLQELQDMNSRRHTDNFIPSQKSPISLNRYDDFDDLAPSVKPRPRSPEHRLCARALYNFVGQSARELTFRKGDIIYLRRQIDKNWYEGELNAMVGLFPANYVEIIPFEGMKTKSTLRKAHEGQARAKYNFVAQTHLELSLAKGELVVITRKVDDNWFEGKIGGRKGIFPANYVDVLIDPQALPVSSNTKPVASPAAHSLLLNGSSGGKESMGSHSYTPTIPNAQISSSYHAKPVQVINNGSYSSLNTTKNSALSQALHIETQSEPTPYRAMYKYKPQNEDELELLEGDTVYVLEKCDDGWYVGSSERTGAFGTFPGNYVEKI